MALSLCEHASVWQAKAGIGVEDPTAAGESDDAFDAYKKKMMKAYSYRPNGKDWRGGS